MDPLVVQGYEDNYRPVSDPEITWDEVEFTYLATNYKVTGGDDGDCNLYWDLYANLLIRADNGVIYKTYLHHNKNGYTGRGLSGCDADQGYNWNSDLSLAHSLLGPNPPAYSGGDWIIRSKFGGDYTHILAAINNQIASTQGGLPLPPPNPNDERKLAVPVLFIHGKGDSVERWGAAFARRECKSPKIVDIFGVKLLPSSYSSTERRQKTMTDPFTGVERPVTTVDKNGHSVPVMIDVPVQRYCLALSIAGSFAHCDDGFSMTTPEFSVPGWYQPGGGAVREDANPTSMPLSVDPLFDPASRRLRVVTAMPAVRVEGLREVTDMTATLLSWQVDASRSYDSPMPQAPRRGAAWHLVETVNFGANSWSIYRQDLSVQEFVPYASFVQELSEQTGKTGDVLPNGETLVKIKDQSRAQNEGLVSAYATGSGPDILARIEHLDRRFRWWDPYSGINNNGIYFFSAVNDFSGARQGFTAKIGAPPAAWNPLAYPDFLTRLSRQGYHKFEEYVKGDALSRPGYLGRGQAFQLYQRMIEVLDLHYPDGWRDNPDAKIDLVAHSHGGLLVRDLLAHKDDLLLPDSVTPMPRGLAHPAAHIRKFVTLNSPHFGSPFADKEEDISPEFGVVRTLKDWMKNEQVLKERTVVDLSSIEDGIMGGSVGLGCGVGAAIGGPAGCILGGGAGGLAALWGTSTEAHWSMQGKAMGPYNLRVEVDYPWPADDVDDITTIDPPALQQIRDRLIGAEPLSYDVGTKSAWITDMKDAGYPTIPTAGGQGNLPLWTQPLYTRGMPKLRTDIGTELRRVQQEYCDEHADDWVETCEIVSWILNGVAVVNAEDQGTFYKFFRDFHNEWSSKSDLVVDSASQSMVRPIDGFDPRQPSLVGIFQAPQEFPLQKEFGTGSAKEVAHVPINHVLDLTLPSEDPPMGVTSSSHYFELRRPGAPRMGPDIYAALYGDTLLRGGVQPVAPHAQPVSLPILVNTSSAAGRLAGDLGTGIQDVTATGDFQVQAWSQDPVVQGVGVRLNATGPLMVAVFYDRRQGAFLWTNNPLVPGGQRVVLGNSQVPPRLSLQREGMVWSAKAEFQGGDVQTARLMMPIPLPPKVRVGVLSSAEGRQAAVTPPALLGTLKTLPDPLVDAYREWNLVPYVREQSGAPNQSNPRIALHNADSRPLAGVYLEYWFTADPARNPVIEFDRTGGVTWEVVHHGGTQYVLKMQAPSAVVATGGVFPDADGISFRIHDLNWTPRWNRGDWSRDRNIGIAQATQRIVVRSADGRILAGELPPAPDPGRTTRVRVMARDAGASETNHLKPELRIRNLGPVPLDHYTVQWFVRVPDGVVPQLDDWSQVATVGLQSMGQGLWKIEARFDRYVLFPQQESPTLKLGVHLPNWPTWNKAGSPSAVGGDWVEHQSVVVLDGQGRRLWGNLPDFPAVLPEAVPPTDPVGNLGALEVQARDEQPGDRIYARPRVRVVNQGATSVKGFQLGLWIHAEGSPPLLLDAAWYAPGCAVSVAPAGVGQKLTYSCPDVTLAPGATWPDPAGSVVGLHLPLWSEWGRESSWSLAGLTGNFAPMDRITIETPAGVVVKGRAP